MDFFKFSEILDTLNRKDWLINYEGRPIVYKNDLNLSFHTKYLGDGFNEDWATKHPDPNATQVRGYFYYGNNPIMEVFLVSVDGGRAILPYPKSDTNRVITRREYNIATLINDRLDEYLQRSNIRVE